MRMAGCPLRRTLPAAWIFICTFAKSRRAMHVIAERSFKRADITEQWKIHHTAPAISNPKNNMVHKWKYRNKQEGQEQNAPPLLHYGVFLCLFVLCCLSFILHDAVRPHRLRAAPTHLSQYGFSPRNPRGRRGAPPPPGRSSAPLQAAGHREPP